MTVPPSLLDPALEPVWQIVRERLERSGVDNRGRVRLPAELAPSARAALGAVLDGPVRATVGLGRLEAGLARLGLAPDLAHALVQLGQPVSPEPALRRATRASAVAARSAVRAAVTEWPEPWASAWIDEVVRAGTFRGLDETDALALLSSARSVLDHLAASATDRGPIVSRTDLAARVVGSSHALDRGTRLEAAVTRALAHLYPDARDRDLWERAGAHSDLVSAPALTWRLPVLERCGLAQLTAAAAELGVPLHLSQLALRRHPVAVAPGTDVLVVENPRIVEAAAQRSVPFAVVATNGNPSSAVVLLVDQLRSCGARLRYHGDFDAAGLGICARMAHRGLAPWRMGRVDYQRALADAEQAGIDLPTDERSAGPTPWDLALQGAFNDDRRIVHEERLLDQLLGTTS